LAGTGPNAFEFVGEMRQCEYEILSAMRLSQKACPHFVRHSAIGKVEVMNLWFHNIVHST
jgi:hypothetical protein